MSKKRTQNEIYKISLNKVVESKNNITDYTDEKAILQGETVKIMDNLVFKKINDYYNEHSDEKELSVKQMAKDIVNIVIPPDKNGKEIYLKLAVTGFNINDVEMKRLMSGSGQIRRNTISFIRKKLYDYVFNALLCGLTLADFGNDFNAAKFNAYLGLNMSGSLLLKDFPRVCIIDDYEEIIPNIKVNYIRTENVKFLVLPDGDYLLDEVKDDFVFYDSKNKETEDLSKADTAIRKSDLNNNEPSEWKVFSGTRKYPEVIEYDKIGKEEGLKDSPAPPLNSFDGQGLANPSWVKKVADELGFDYLPSQMIIRAPWVKGLVATFPISDFLKDKGVKTVTSLCGDIMNVDDVDIFISKSQFKMFKVYMKKVELLDEKITAWEYHQKAMKNNDLLWGVVMPNKKFDDDKKESNYQYNQALNLSEESDIDKLTEKTEKHLKKLCGHDIEYVYRTLISNRNVEKEESCDDEVNSDEPEEEVEYQTLLQKIVTHNIDMLNDRYIQSLINKECQRAFKRAMIGKLIWDGNFQFIVSDPVAQAEWIYKNHTVNENGNHPDIKINGVVKAGEIYSNYWKQVSKNKKKQSEQIVIMRSPLIDQHEIVKANLIMDDIKWFDYLKSGVILSIHDLFTLQMQNCDFDGDRCFSSNMDILKKGCLDESYPLYYEPGAKGIDGEINDENMIVADCRGLNSKVGQLSNKSTSFYAMLPLYLKDSKEYISIQDSISVLGEVVGTEIDKIKTGIPPVSPYNWKPIQPSTVQNKEGDKLEKNYLWSDEQVKAVYHHNDLIPDMKPYFFRYIYSYLDKDIKTLENEIGKECKYNYGMKLTEFLDECNNDNFFNKAHKLFDKKKEYKETEKKEYEFTEEELEIVRKYATVRKYLKAYPVLDTQCIMNRICHKFEKILKEFNKFKGEDNLLKQYIIQDMDFDMEILNRITEYVMLYKKHRKFITKNNNTRKDGNNKNIAKETRERLDSLMDHTREHIYSLFTENCDKRIILTYLLKVAKGDDVKFVWMIMGDDLLEIIPKKHTKRRRIMNDNF